MTFFGWLAANPEPPAQWDLRFRGWELCHGRQGCRTDCKHVLLVDARGLKPVDREKLVVADHPAWRLIMIGVEEAAERANLLSGGCAEALPASVKSSELTARAKRVSDMFGLLPRWRTQGPLTLDLFHRDARKGARWLHLHPREFGVLWRLADEPGKRVSRSGLLKDVWRIDHDPETNSVEVHVSRLRAKLADAGCENLVLTAPEGGYRLQTAFPNLCMPAATEADALDLCLRKLHWAREDSESARQF